MSHPETWAKKKQDPLGGTFVSPRDVGKKTKPTRRGLLMPLLSIKGAWELTHVPQIRREGLVVASPLLRGT